MKYYIGEKKNTLFIFRSWVVPSLDRQPEGVIHCHGGFVSRRRAEQVAVDIPKTNESGHGRMRYPIKEWPKDFS